MAVILVAYERESEQVALEKLLATRGHRVVKATNGLEALDAARREPPHAVVSDIVLPRMDGFALCRKWKQDERLASVPFIFYTRRHDDPKYERFALELGAERFLARTEQPEALVRALDELVKTPDAPSAASNATVRMPALSDSAHRPDALERAQQALAMATERAQQAQARLRNQIGELETTNQRLAAGEARFRRIFEANPLPMWIADHATGGFIAVNDAALRACGHSRAEFLSLKAEALIDTTATVDAGVVAYRRKNGSTLYGQTASQSIEFDGRNADLVSVCDLSERIQIEQKRVQEAADAERQRGEAALAEQQRQLEAATASRSLLDAMTDGYWVLDAEGRILEANAAYCRMSGYSREELLKLRAADIEQQGSGDATARLKITTASADRYEVQHKRRDGSLMDVEVSVGQLDGGPADAVLVIRDVSQRRREAAAQRLEQRQLEFLVELFRQSESFDESAIVRRVVEQAAEITNSPVAYLFFVDGAEKTMTLSVWRDRARGQTIAANAEPRSLSRFGVFSECVRARHATSSNDLTWKPQPDGLPDLQRFVAVPMVDGEEAVAVLGVANRDAGYGEADQRLLTALSDGVWRVLQAKRAHGQTLGSLQRTDVALQGMIEALLNLSEKHDPYTAGSARRVAALAVALGREAGLDGERQHALRIAALLHDVGNVAVPPSILAKPGRFNDIETALMRTHVEEGCKLLANIDFGAPVVEIIFEHHERFDGSGYPRAMKGEEIMLEARILAIADVVEAMSSPRPHRPALGLEAAVDEINRGAGVAYDLHLATACTRLVRQHGFRFPE
ncbi:MAG TPA: HD domain-containing phosphohydrolase [Povalibacter sp.]|nr:HD domain-containing phosphohydrolase [Povalibacter sp.]